MTLALLLPLLAEHPQAMVAATSALESQRSIPTHTLLKHPRRRSAMNG